ncbi:MAG: DUF1186 domain-containing protein [bacterium]|nr:DUF1186 domain-containing protein [bacterium]
MYFEKALTLGKDKCLEKLKKDYEHHSIDDIHASMSWWACFNEESKTFASSTDIDNDDFLSFSEHLSIKSQKKKKKAKKKKRKQAKVSKKKNRR